MAGTSSFTYDISREQGEKLEVILRDRGFEFKDLSYGHFAAKKGKCGVHYYRSGKLVINGKEAKEFVEFCFEPEILGEARLGYEQERNPEMFEPHFGVDEAGKGDFYGPLVIAGAYVNQETASKLLEAGIQDSKRIGSDQRTFDLRDAVKAIVGPRGWEVIAIGPTKYNELYDQFRNLNYLLAWGHGKVIENLFQKNPDCPRALSDQFANPRLVDNQLKKKKLDIKLQQRTKAESDIAVAAASILARASFLEGLNRLSKDLGLPLSKGAGAKVVEEGREIATERGAEILGSVCKRHFKTYGRLVGELNI